jgi:glutamate-1-semialdehyde 2,1-aminomutase
MKELAELHKRRSPRSATLNQRASSSLIDGGSHSVRLIDPFPPRIVEAAGAWLVDEDGHRILDLWQGHMANILGHNPEVITSVLAEAFGNGLGLQTGFTEKYQIEAAEVLCRQTGMERVRFTTSGSLATMYALMLARAFTDRGMLMKVGGGWHGGQPWSLKGVRFDQDRNGFKHVESEGLSAIVADSVIVTRFNDCDLLEEHFREHGDRLACFIVEPCLGAGGIIPASPEYLQAARDLTEQYGALLILDEVITGFRFRAGDAASFYGIRPDLATFGKAIGGGMPVAAVAGRKEIMGLVGQKGGQRVSFSGGTYSAHPASMLAASVFMNYLVSREQEIYPRLEEMGDLARKRMEQAFADEGIYARCTGYGNGALPGGSLAMIHFPYEEDARLLSPEDVSDPVICDATLSHHVLRLALLVEDVHVVHGHGGLTTAHGEAEIEFLGNACGKVARRLRACM